MSLICPIISLICPIMSQQGSKKGAVDTKMKMRLAALGEADAAADHGVVVLVIAGLDPKA